MNAPTDLAALKARQRTAWASGDYAVIGTTLQIVGESLAEACDLRTDERVLDVAALKTRQRTAWASGDYAVIGTTLQIVGESLAEACDLRTDERVLDVAAGNGNATLAAARRGCLVTSTDYVGALLERGSERAAAERLQVSFQQADAEALPFDEPASTPSSRPSA